MSQKPEKDAPKRATATDPRSSSQLLRGNPPPPLKQEIEDRQTITSALGQKRRSQAFDSPHERMTLWLDKDLKARFEALAKTQGRATSELLDEAIRDLLNKHGS